MLTAESFGSPSGVRGEKLNTREKHNFLGTRRGADLVPHPGFPAPPLLAARSGGRAGRGGERAGGGERETAGLDFLQGLSSRSVALLVSGPDFFNVKLELVHSHVVLKAARFSYGSQS